MKCIQCRAENADAARFCNQCGSALPLACAECHATNPPGSNFCGTCGARLAPPGSSRHLSAAPSQPALPLVTQIRGERRHLTVLFSDMVGSTALARALDPEDLNAVTRSYYDRCMDAIHRYDGIVANYIGDGVMALFGYPSAHEDDAERAVRAGLDIVAEVHTLTAASKTRVRARVGIASGLVVVGLDGPDGTTKEKMVVGETPNLAAHLQAAVAPNTVVISAPTRRLVRDVFRLEEIRVAGKQPGRAWRVLGEKAASSRFAAHLATLTTFVGRNSEVALLCERWQRAREGDGQVVFLAGEAGIGKSRVLENFRETVSRPAAIEMHYQCSPYHSDSPLYPVIAQIEHAAGIALDETAPAKLTKLESFLKVAGSRMPEILPLLATLLSIDFGGRYPAPDPDPQRRRERTLEALLEMMELLAQREPVLMLFEDVHWADPTTLVFLQRAVFRLRSAPVLLIATHRPEFAAPCREHLHVTALLLNRLGPHHCEAMITSLAHEKPLPAEVVRQIIAKTDGIPLFVEELTKTVLESGLLAEQNAAWVLVQPLPPLAIPATLQDSLVARLDRLSSVREVAQLAATMGREFSYELLAAVCQMREVELRDALSKLTEAGLVFARGSPPDATYIFKHALVQDAAYETLLRSRRQDFHARIAAALQDRFPEMAQTQPEILAHHYTGAGLKDAAVEWWARAGELAIRRSANHEAVRHLSRAVELLKLIPEGRERDERELALRIKLSGPLIATHGYVTAELSENYEEAWRLCNKLHEDRSAFAVMYGQWVIPYVRGDMRAALANSERFLRRAEQQDDVGLLLMGHRIYGSSLTWRGDTLQGSEHLKRALSLYRPEHAQLAYVFSQHPRTAALAHLCLGLQHLGHVDQAMAAGWEAISQAKQIEHFNSIAYSLCFVSLLILLRRDLPTLKQTAGELYQLADRHNASYWLLWAVPMLGWIQAQEGDVEAGVERMQKSSDELARQHANLWVPQTLLLEAEILGQAKEYRRAYRLLDDAQSLIEPLEQRFYEAELHRVRGAVLLAEGADPGAGAASLDRAIDVARRQKSRFLELRATVSKARLWAEFGRRADARALLMPVYAGFVEGLDSVDLREAHELLQALA